MSVCGPTGQKRPRGVRLSEELTRGLLLCSARELGGEPQAYRPPALRNGALAAVGDEALSDQASAYGAGYRRARAGCVA